MYLENLKREYKILEDNIKKLEEDYLRTSNNDVMIEIIHLKEDLIKLGYKIKKEELFNNYRDKKPMKYHLVDGDSEIDVMLDYGDVNYDVAYKQCLNEIFADEAYDSMVFERENSKYLIDDSLHKQNDGSESLLTDTDMTQKNDITEENAEISGKNDEIITYDYKYLVFKKDNIIHIVSDAPISYLRNNVELIKKYNDGKNFRFILHNDLSNNMTIEDVLVKFDSSGITLEGEVDEFESSEKVGVVNNNDVIEEDENVTLADLSNEESKTITSGDVLGEKKVNLQEFINLAKDDDYSNIIKLFSFYGSALIWRSFGEGIKNGLISREDFDFFVNYLKGNLFSDNSLYSQIFNNDFKDLENVHVDFDNDVISNDVASPIPAKVVKRKKASKSLIQKFKELSRGKKIAVVAAGAIVVLGIGFIAAHMVPMVIDKINGDSVNTVSHENVDIIKNVNEGIKGFLDKTQNSFKLVKDSLPHFNTINPGDTVFSSASDSISSVNGVSASGDFRDTVVAVFDSNARKAIEITPDNIDSIRHLLDDPNVPKAFGDSFTPGNVSGWKTGNGYKTILDAVNIVGGKSL